jgi:chromosome segregation protein
VLRLEVERLHHETKSARAEQEGVERELHERQMALAEVNVRRDELTTRTIADLGLNPAERYEQYAHQEQDWAAVEAEIDDLKGKIARLGNVNLDAIAELEEIERRHEFLSRQRADLEESVRQLRQLIERLNAESKERFLAAFEQIREHFRAMFRKLFGGGRADVVLEDPENLLECGVEIVAQPPGKDLQNISLMSGGEKSLTAIALLMSIFQSRPAPFAILDEVDAALDEANNDRFNQIVKEFVNQAQFLIITHSKRTMGVADQLYGITMQEPGVSTRVSVRLSEVHAA